MRCNHLEGQKRLFLDYFDDPPVFPPNALWRRFQITHSLFLCIHYEVEAHELYFVQKRIMLECLVRLSFRRQLRQNSDWLYRWLPRIAECMTMKSLNAKAVSDFSSDEYLRSPNNNDIARQLAIVKVVASAREHWLYALDMEELPTALYILVTHMNQQLF